MSQPEFESFTLACRGLRFSARALGEGPVVLLLHGFPDTYRSFDAQLCALAGAGYRAVGVAMRGYEPASQPADRDYSGMSLARDVVAFLDELGAERAYLVGHDWGASIAYTVAAIAPDRLMAMVTMSVPHTGRFLQNISRYPKQLRMSWYMGFFQLPGIPEWTVRRNDFAFLRWLWRRWSPGWSFSDGEFAELAETFAEPGVVEAALAYYRTAINLSDLRPGAPQPEILDVPVPTLAMTGDEEGCIDADVFVALSMPEDFSGGLRVERVADAGHFLHREQPEAVNRLLLDWFGTHAA